MGVRRQFEVFNLVGSEDQEFEIRRWIDGGGDGGGESLVGIWGFAWSGPEEGGAGGIGEVAPDWVATRIDGDCAGDAELLALYRKPEGQLDVGVVADMLVFGR